MPSYDVAHVQEQGQDMLIFPLDSSFERKTTAVQNEELGVLETRARSAGLRGSAVAVWLDGSGRMRFLSPQPWHAFLQKLSHQTILQNVNKTISW